ncbi:hypothetical protein CGZ93_04815 [Enemella dayhoffiae]|uniref:DUF4244 domain-containing protein n=1 Tax=Enemella dayhoffiae TaxID=2016507 RepID=A0A255H9K4_9ACTN|nr:DUF4244 domain-containing protein [Enemella dayhoffiae]OYO24142.1 hypothetical protein CGZ93_04815 [Enemella dayhoffiae]
MSQVQIRQHDERSAAAVEYAVVTVAATSIGGVLLGLVPIYYPRFLEFFERLILELFKWFGLL